MDDDFKEVMRMAGIRYQAVVAAALMGVVGGFGMATACEAPVKEKGTATRSLAKGVLRGWSGAHSGVGDRVQRVIRTQGDWQKLWSQARASETPAPPAPKIDWGREMVIAVFMGERNSGGYGVAIREVKFGEKEIVVSVEESSPPADAITIQVMTQPYHVVVVKRSDLPVRFVAVGKANVKPAPVF
jgi:hypothetical protein